MDSFIINISWEYFLGIMSSLILITWCVSAKFSKIEVLLGTIDDKFTTLEGRVNGFFGSYSPISLTVKGEKLLEDSGLKEYIDQNRKEFYPDDNDLKDIKTAYDVQEFVFSSFGNIKFENTLADKLEEFIYQHGTDMNILKRIGGIYLRDILLEELNMNKEDIDKEDIDKKNINKK